MEGSKTVVTDRNRSRITNPLTALAGWIESVYAGIEAVVVHLN